MIIVQLVGGLGNQMFEYAAARSLAIINKTEVKLDVSNYEKDPFRRYGLDCFKINASIASPLDILQIYPSEGFIQLGGKICGKKCEELLRHYLTKFGLHKNYSARHYAYNLNSKDQSPLLEKKIVSQRQFHYDPDFFHCPDNIYLIGFWISEKYFIHINETIREDFSFRFPASKKNKEFLKIINNCNSVSVHIRRTDKINEPLYEETNLIYCTKAMQYISEKISDPHFFIFSDDIFWVKNNLKYPGLVTFVDINDDFNNYEDLRLMSSCKHNIIAESSFSWWAAWLNSNNEKIVISPDPCRWIRLDNFIFDDLLPSNWKVLKIN